MSPSLELPAVGLRHGRVKPEMTQPIENYAFTILTIFPATDFSRF
jgi:hypothetical protein